MKTMSKANYDGCIVLNKTDKTVYVYRYVRYDNGQNDLLSDTTYNFETIDEAKTFAERMNEAYKSDGIRMVVKD
jgi:hypothetical protein